MADFIEEFIGNYGSEVSQQVSSNLGIKKSMAEQIIPMVAPLILGGLKKQMEQHGGGDRVNYILDKHGSASVLDDIGETLTSQAGNEKPDPRLGGLLGDSGVEAADTLSKKFNLDGNTAMKLITMLAPIILGALTQKRDTGGAGASGIASLINQQGDSGMLEDVAGSLLGSFLGSESGTEDSPLGGLLKGLTRRRKGAR